MKVDGDTKGHHAMSAGLYMREYSNQATISL